MYPFYPIYSHRRPSRILWFLVGAGVATFWHNSRAMREHRAQYFPCVMRQRRVDGPSAVDSPRPSDPAGLQDGRWVWKANRGPEHETDGTLGWNQREWEEDKERLRNLQKRAGEAVADFSESTLDSVVAAAESLKAKLAEHRVLREQLMKGPSEQLDTEKKDTLKAA
ncbi:hypothetical protein F5I97DRAFT_1923248 [Phlebopus sp. FC_14]|nr:hypothetical protein F5I97DRAFT_1923248 [Phlebopus sp. FC_14]